jgi:hypothetical protein
MFYCLSSSLPAWATALLKTLPEGAVTEFKADLRRLHVMSGRPGRCAA